MSRLVYVDAGVLIAAARGRNEAALRAMEILDDPGARFASSVFLKLEVLPKAVFNNRRDEVSFYEAFFAAVAVWAEPDGQLIEGAYCEAIEVGLSAMDALHVAAAGAAGAAELVTTEKSTHALHRTRLVPVRTITPEKVG